MREKSLFDYGWLFHKGDVEMKTPQVKGPIYTSAKTERKKQGPACVYYNDAADDFRTDVEFNADKWQYVSLPHDYVVSGEMSENNNPALGFFEYENAWYRKHFTIEKSEKSRRFTLYFEGVATRCIVYLNGCELWHNLCGYTPFEVDITDFVKFGEDNVLAVYTYYDDNEGWWYQGGGIFRHVWLCKTEPLCVDLYGVYAMPIFDGKNWTVDFETTLVNDYFDDVNAYITTDIISEDGITAATANAEVNVEKRSKRFVKYSTKIENPVLWDLKKPYLYDIVTYVRINGNIIDTYKTRTGFRYFEFDPDNGFILNGKKTEIKGVCGHGDFGLTGKAVPDNIFRYKVKLMKEMGANGYRCSHYPQADAMMDALDELGFVVMCESRWFDSSDEGKKALETHIKRDRNRPSVFMWSLGNEEPHHLTDTGRRINKSLYYFAKQLDKYRPITSAVSNAPDKATIFEDIDLIGINYNHWLYDDMRAAYPNKPIFSSECCATGTTRGWYFDESPEKGYCSAYDLDANSWWTSRERFYHEYKSHPFLFGFFQWIAFEHRGEAAWPRICSQSGAIDLFLQKKDAFYQNKAYFTNEPMVHLLPHWNFAGLEGEKIKVFAYTNCDELELLFNGKAVSRQSIKPFTHGEWLVEYSSGTLECVGFKDGKRVCSDSICTTGKAVSLKLRLDNEGDVTANSQDIAMVTCYCVDENGRVVPDATPTVDFLCNGLGTIVGTGSDVCDHTPVSATARKMRAGRIGVAVRVKEKNGVLKVFATADGLSSAVLNIDI